MYGARKLPQGFTPEMKLFVVMEKEKGSTYPMNPCDSFLWGYLKKAVYKPFPINMVDLKATIKREFRAIPEVMVRQD